MLIDKLNELFAVLLVLIASTLLIWLTDADRWLAALAFDKDTGWIGVNAFFWEFIYTWAPLPAWLTGGIALFVLLLGSKVVTLRRLRKQAIFILLFLLLGPGLIANVLLKDNLGRPRPREVVEFNGQHQFHLFWEPGQAGANSSFPSGHASIAFALIGPWFVFRKFGREDARFLLLIGIGWGTLVGITRILQGGHFLSDTLWAGGIVYIVGQLLAIWIKPELPAPDKLSLERKSH
ncbi:phosphatase PAP2 family protein [Desulfogranum marinum]|jgi:membrane-associated PAP2 superfamily phosphatase|uniref:phosphatase PAP2 family protein n=1 Tax=Desulfogranum marinum TaxID=453220 RepID=UPI0029C6A48F|nr:phosphatase PAP2 family protein [Desulfogranum marinum]